MERTNTQYQDFAEVLISFREPFSKNTLWVQPKDGNIYIKVFDKGWKTVASTEDTGLSEKSAEQVKDLVNSLERSLVAKIRKQLGQYVSNSVHMTDRTKELENKIKELENKLEKLTKRYASKLV